MPIGGQEQPSSKVGESLLWKKAQKKEKKKQTSEIINIIIPYRKPLSTILVWKPIKVLSRITSRHHWIMVRTTNKIPSIKQKRPLLWNQKTKPIAVKKAPKEPVRGQGLASTKWKGWRSIKQ
jgi:hypothetical protein